MFSGGLRKGETAAWLPSSPGRAKKKQVDGSPSHAPTAHSALKRSPESGVGTCHGVGHPLNGNRSTLSINSRLEAGFRFRVESLSLPRLPSIHNLLIPNSSQTDHTTQSHQADHRFCVSPSLSSGVNRFSTPAFSELLEALGIDTPPRAKGLQRSLVAVRTARKCRLDRFWT